MYRSRVLVAPRGVETRPTSDRLRETLFNVIAARVPGSRFADLYAGSGAVGIEAISRGAAMVYFAETAAPAVSAIRANLRGLGVASGYVLEAGGTGALLRGLREPLDVAFLDPPYEAAEEYTRTLRALGEGALLAEGGLVVAEHAKRLPLPEVYGRLKRTRVLTQGDAALSFYAVGE